MSVLFPLPSNQTILQANNPSQLLQGFMNIEKAENVTNGKLTQANLDSYSQKRFFAVDPNSDVSAYLKQNFAKISGNDGDASSISADDLVQLRQNLPQPQTPPKPLPTPYPQNQESMMMFLNMFKTLLTLLSSMMRG